MFYCGSIGKVVHKSSGSQLAGLVVGTFNSKVVGKVARVVST